MAEQKENSTRRSREMAVVATANLSVQTETFSRDPIHGFMSASTETHQKPRNETFHRDDGADEYDDEEIELNLGLSLGGRFGVDKTPGKLKRSSSIVGTTPIFIEADESSEAAAGHLSSVPYATAGLTRTTSLPAEMDLEWRKRKGMQTLRRMEAKRRRSEKQKNSKICSGNWNSYNMNVDFEEAGLTASFGLESWVSAAEKSGFLQKLPVSRQGSVESDGGGGSSSSMSELDCKPLNDKPLRRHNSVDKRGKETAVEDMPCVFTKGRGPNGRRIEGILYKYGKGEEVRIMCVCHGNFLSPAEFVKHAGGGDVDHPLRHIVVNPTSSASSLL